MFDDKSRYAGIAVASLTLVSGRAVAYVGRRLVPPAESYTPVGAVTVTDSDRLDHFAYRHFGLPTAFWQIADANEAAHPGELTQPSGRRLVIPLPLGARRTA